MGMSIISEKLEDIRNYLDVEVHPVISPDRWDIYAVLCDMVDEIIVLMKAQEPRVMTLEEVIALKENTPVYIEHLNGYHGWDVYVGIDPVDNDITTGAPWSPSEYWPQSSYLDAWRCWTSRPDEKVRAETPWE